MARTADAPSKSVNAGRGRKRVEAETSTTTLKRAKNGSAFTRCEACNKDVAVALISMHDCGLDAKIKMNLEAQVVETTNDSVAKKPTERKRLVKVGDQPAKRTKKEKKVRDPTKPKKPPTAFFLFMDEFRVTYKAANPDNKKVSMVAKEGGEKWKGMTEEEKKPFTTRAAELKEEYQKALETPNDAENANVNDDENENVKVEAESIEDEDEEASPEKEEEIADDDE